MNKECLFLGRFGQSAGLIVWWKFRSNRDGNIDLEVLFTVSSKRFVRMPLALTQLWLRLDLWSGFGRHVGGKPRRSLDVA
jgi:hypothetical protein